MICITCRLWFLHFPNIIIILNGITSLDDSNSYANYGFFVWNITNWVKTFDQFL